MKSILMFIFALLLMPTQFAFSNELDRDLKNQQRLAQDLPQTLIVRINNISGDVAILNSNERLSTDARPDDSAFVTLKSTDTLRSELDRDSSTSGWFFFWGHHSYRYPTYRYWGYNYYYHPYYNYYNPYSNCYYYWYSWF